jgi:hypothetical protein
LHRTSPEATPIGLYSQDNPPYHQWACNTVKITARLNRPNFASHLAASAYSQIILLILVAMMDQVFCYCQQSDDG